MPKYKNTAHNLLINATHCLIKLIDERLRQYTMKAILKAHVDTSHQVAEPVLLQEDELRIESSVFVCLLFAFFPFKQV